ncbi:MAG: beta-lactamase family protein [bacterium]|nr:beta-lactamase family protein [bacterium]
MNFKNMKTCLKIFVLSIVIICTFSSGSLSQTIDIDRVAAEFEPEIRKVMLEGSIPSVAVALVSGENIIWKSAYGYSNIWARTPAVTSTIYLIGSTFKAMSMYALLQQMEDGKFELDDNVSSYLNEFNIRNEDPENRITFRHLLTHTSGLPGDFGPHDVWGETVPPSLKEYLSSSLTAANSPMERVEYSNMAYTLVGYLIEKFSGITYKRYMQKNIFDPIGMKDTAFIPRRDMEERLAIPYVLESGEHVPALRLKANVWPAGIVYGTVIDQANWLITNLNDGRFGRKRLLSKETVDEIMTRQYDQFAGPVSRGWLNETTGYGLTWWISERNGNTVFAHSGSVPGYTAFLAGDREQKIGFAILSNGNRAHPHLYHLAKKALELMELYRDK